VSDGDAQTLPAISVGRRTRDGRHLNVELNMTDQDALTLVFTCLTALNYDRHFRGELSALEMPTGLLRQALAYLEERLGTGETATVRVSFASYGLDFPDPSSCARTELPHEQAAYDSAPTSIASGDIEGSQSWRRIPRSRVPRAIADVVRAKHREGWSKSRIAREFRLNRRTVIRICSGQ
jgi:hypothetical protein